MTPDVAAMGAALALEQAFAMFAARPETEHTLVRAVCAATAASSKHVRLSDVTLKDLSFAEAGVVVHFSCSWRTPGSHGVLDGMCAWDSPRGRFDLLDTSLVRDVFDPARTLPGEASPAWHASK